MGGKIRLIIFIALASCTPEDEDMRLFLNTLEQQQQSAPLTELKIVLTDGNQDETYVSSVLLGKELKQQVEAFKPIENLVPNNLDYADVYLDADQIKYGEEDCAPYRILGTTTGGNHSWYCNWVTSAGHGKTDADIGSIWNNGTEDTELWSIYSDDMLWMGSNDDAGTTYTHVSGATNTASFTITTKSFRQFYPCSKNHSLVLKIDGVEQAIVDGTYEAQSDIVFEESYDIISKGNARTWLIANVGNITSNSENGGVAVVRVTNKVRYTRYGNTLENDFLVLPDGDGLGFQDIMFAMGFYMTPSANYPVLSAYIPKALPYTDETGTWDWANIEDMTGKLPLSTRTDITPARAEATGIFSDRHCYLLDGVGFSMGFLPVYDTDPSVRRIRANNKAMQIASSGKVYMSAIDDNGQSIMNDGDYFKTIAYKQFFESTQNRTVFHIVDSGEGDYYLYADWHNLPYNDTLEIPSELYGKYITLVEKSDNVSYTGTQIGSTLDVTITDSESYGYLILKL